MTDGFLYTTPLDPRAQPLIEALTWNMRHATATTGVNRPVQKWLAILPSCSRHRTALSSC